MIIDMQKATNNWGIVNPNELPTPIVNWMVYTFVGMLSMWMVRNGYDLPDKLLTFEQVLTDLVRQAKQHGSKVH